MKGFPFVFSLQEIEHLWKETTTTSSSLEQVPHTVRLFAGAAKTTGLEENHGGYTEAFAKQAAVDAQAAATVSPDTPNVLQTTMQLEQAKTRAKTTNNLALEAEKKKR